jgi:ribosome-binding factor A
MGRRSDRLGQQIGREVSLLLQNGVKDVRIGFVTVSRVDLTDDLSLARIRVSIMGTDAERKSTLIALERVQGFVRTALGRRLKVRHTPKIEFIFDRNLDHSFKMQEILSKISDPDLDSIPTSSEGRVEKLYGEDKE